MSRSVMLQRIDPGDRGVHLVETDAGGSASVDASMRRASASSRSGDEALVAQPTELRELVAQEGQHVADDRDPGVRLVDVVERRHPLDCSDRENA